MSRRFQFSLKWLFVAMFIAATFCGGMAVQRSLDEPTIADRARQHQLLLAQVSRLEEELRFATMLSVTEMDTAFTPEHRFFMDEESWSLVQHAAERAGLDESVWIKKRLTKVAGDELRHWSSGKVLTVGPFALAMSLLMKHFWPPPTVDEARDGATPRRSAR